MTLKRSGNLWTLLLLFFLFILFQGCEKGLGIKNKTADASLVYNDFWHAMDTKYSLFTLKHANWDSARQAGTAKLQPGMSNDDLFTLIKEDLDRLKDGHVALTSPDRRYQYDLYASGASQNFNLENIKSNYLGRNYLQSGPFIYKVSDSIGYIYCASFSNTSPQTTYDSIFKLIEHTKGIILDMRNNSGGSLQNAETLFSMFTDEKRLVRYELRKIGPGHDEFSPAQGFYVAPSYKQYHGKIALLTNRSCYSACNDFVMYMNDLPNVQIIGDRTGGGGAVPATYLLLNGWLLQYSATVTLSAARIPAEYGISPDFLVNITSADDRAGKDPIFEKGYSILK